MLIGLRTRELLQQLLEARCRLSPVVMVIEDLHWIDSVSEEVLGKIVDSESKLRLLHPHHAPAGIRTALARPRGGDQTPSGAAAGRRHSPLGGGAARGRGSARGAGAAGDGEGRGQSAVRRGDRELPHRARHAARRRRQVGVRRQRGGGSVAGERAKPADRARGPPRAKRPCAPASGRR